MLGYLIGFFLYESVGLALLGALGLTDAFPPAACYLREYGAEIILIKGATPIPFKLLTITAGFIHMSFKSEEHTSELQSLMHLVCRLLLEKNNNKNEPNRSTNN